MAIIWAFFSLIATILKKIGWWKSGFNCIRCGAFCWSIFFFLFFFISWYSTTTQKTRQRKKSRKWQHFLATTKTATRRDLFIAIYSGWFLVVFFSSKNKKIYRKFGCIFKMDNPHKRTILQAITNHFHIWIPDKFHICLIITTPPFSSNHFEMCSRVCIEMFVKH